MPRSGDEEAPPLSIDDGYYAGSCNPPRRAKRPRPMSLSEITDPAAPARPHREARHGPVEADQQPAHKQKKKSTMSRAAREAQRKINHSMIEKARRTKINDALATLRVLVPPSPLSQKGDETVNGEIKGDEKEFKLEILVRTVGYLEDLRARVNMLEKELDVSAVGASPARPKSKRKLEDHAMQTDSVDVKSPPTSPKITSPKTQTWVQLPSPPMSATMHPSITLQTPPTLLLPLPNIPLPPPPPATSPISPSTPRSAWTSEDQNAASLLLQMRARHAPPSARHPPQDVQYRAETPGSLLGLTK
ncbi:hypothetical protein PLICRDRAFT_51915 [Plicaturopsis crispa FD-325 SS-3]|nr:hypothetical protein PLICRDRAFT_51915 [Plicaturopsis crispa FD-325 SS-3]